MLPYQLRELPGAAGDQLALQHPHPASTPADTDHPSTADMQILGEVFTSLRQIVPVLRQSSSGKSTPLAAATLFQIMMTWPVTVDRRPAPQCARCRQAR